jgi:hypothetical protein
MIMNVHANAIRTAQYARTPGNDVIEARHTIAYLVEKAAVLLLLGAACAALFGIVTGTGADLPMLLP